MTFSDIVTVLGAGVGIVVLLAMVATPLLPDRAPGPRRRPAAAGSSTPAPGIPAQRSPARADRIGVRAVAGALGARAAAPARVTAG